MKCIIFVARDESKSGVYRDWENEWNTWCKKFDKKCLKVNSNSYSYIEIVEDGTFIILKRGEYIDNNMTWDDCIPSTIYDSKNCLNSFIDKLKAVLSKLKEEKKFEEFKIAIHGIGSWANYVEEKLKEELNNINIGSVKDYSSTTPKFKNIVEELWNQKK